MNELDTHFHPLVPRLGKCPPILRAHSAIDIKVFLDLRSAFFAALKRGTLPSSFLAGPVDNINGFLDGTYPVSWVYEHGMTIASFRVHAAGTALPHRDRDNLLMVGRPKNATGTRSTHIWHGSPYHSDKAPDEVVDWQDHPGMMLVINDTLGDAALDQRTHAAAGKGENTATNILVRYLTRIEELSC